MQNRNRFAILLCSVMGSQPATSVILSFLQESAQVGQTLALLKRITLTTHSELFEQRKLLEFQSLGYQALCTGK